MSFEVSEDSFFQREEFDKLKNDVFSWIKLRFYFLFERKRENPLQYIRVSVGRWLYETTNKKNPLLLVPCPSRTLENCILYWFIVQGKPFAS